MKRPITIVIPVYNERNAVIRTVKKAIALLDLLPPDSEVVIVDDGSTDGTRERLEDFAASQSGFLRVVSHDRNRGYGRALKTGIRASRSHIIAITDADGTYPIEAIPDLVDACESEEAAMAVGVRSVAHQPAIRRPAKAVLIWLAEYLSGEKIPDLNSGLRVFRKADAERFNALLPDGFSFTTTITMALLSEGERIAFLPIRYRKRVGSSKIKPIRDTLNFLFLICRMALAFQPMKIFGPMGLLMILAGAALLVARLVSPVPFGAVTTVALIIGGFQVLAIGLLADLINRRGR